MTATRDDHPFLREIESRWSCSIPLPIREKGNFPLPDGMSGLIGRRAMAN
jgi:hypothetical protein